LGVQTDISVIVEKTRETTGQGGVLSIEGGKSGEKKRGALKG